MIARFLGGNPAQGKTSSGALDVVQHHGSDGAFRREREGIPFALREKPLLKGSGVVTVFSPTLGAEAPGFSRG
jgi:hypothetical protein